METGIGINWKPIRQLKVFIRIIGVDLSHSDFSQSVVDVHVIVNLLERDLDEFPLDSSVTKQTHEYALTCCSCSHLFS